MRPTKRKTHVSQQTAEALLKGTGLLSKNQAFEQSSVSWNTFVRALSINFKGNRPKCGLKRTPPLKAVHYKIGQRVIVAVAPKDLKQWKQIRAGLNRDGSIKKKRLRPAR